jgi:hypothetical protein
MLALDVMEVDVYSHESWRLHLEWVGSTNLDAESTLALARSQVVDPLWELRDGGRVGSSLLVQDGLAPEALVIGRVCFMDEL